MAILSKSPLKAKHPKIKKQFDEWWLFLNSTGLFSFTLFLASLGANKDKYFCVILSALLVLWILFMGKAKFPEFLINLRKSNSEGAKQLEKAICKEQFNLIQVSFAYFPYWLGLSSLFILAVQPVAFVQKITLYVPNFLR